MNTSSEQTHKMTRENTLKNIQEQVNERGFYLYEWISQEEFTESIRLEYLKFLEKSGTYIAFIAFIATIITIIKIMPNISEIIISDIYDIFILIVIHIFYALPWTFWVTIICFILLSIVLIFSTIPKWHLYTKYTNIAVTDKHLITGGKIISHKDFSEKNPDFMRMSEIFHEPIFSHSILEANIDAQEEKSNKKLFSLFSAGIKASAQIWKKSTEYGNFGRRKRDWDISAWLSLIILILILSIGGIFYIIMKITHFVFLPIIMIFSYMYSGILHKILLHTNNQEYKIQSLFKDIDENANNLQKEKNIIQNHIWNASNNEWKDNLFGKILENFNTLNLHAKNSTEQSLTLKTLLQNSQYNEIFNFQKYHIWIKKQIITPLEDLISLLEKNEKILENTLKNLKIQISETENPELQKPLILSEKRLELQLSEFSKMKHILYEYISKLS